MNQETFKQIASRAADNPLIIDLRSGHTVRVAKSNFKIEAEYVYAKVASKEMFINYDAIDRVMYEGEG